MNPIKQVLTYIIKNLWEKFELIKHLNYKIQFWMIVPFTIKSVTVYSRCDVGQYCSTALIKQPICFVLFAFVIPEHRPGICMDSFLLPITSKCSIHLFIRYSSPLSGPAFIINLDNFGTQIRQYLACSHIYMHTEQVGKEDYAELQNLHQSCQKVVKLNEPMLYW